MVLGHAGFPFTHFIYLFHMAIFFIASGYMWDDKNVATIADCCKYLLRKFKTLWLPFIIANGIFNLCNNLFLLIGIYTNDELFLQLTISGNDKLIDFISFKETIIAILKNILFTGGTQMGGATWFLRTLFAVSIINMVLRYLYRHFKFGKPVFWGCVVLSVIAAQIVTMSDISLTLGINTYFAAYVAFLMGMFLKHYNIMESIKGKYVIIWICTLVILLIMNNFVDIGMNTGLITNVIFFVIVSLAGWIFIYGIALLVNKTKLRSIFSYVGRHTLWILLLHFLSFKIVSCIYIMITGVNKLYLAAFPVIKIAGGAWWIAYTVVGVAVPLMVEWLIKSGISCTKKIMFKSEEA